MGEVTVFNGLDAEELRTVQQAIRHRHPTVSLIVQKCERDYDETHLPDAWDLLVSPNDFEIVRHSVCEVLEVIRPISPRLAEQERNIVLLLNDMLDSRSYDYDYKRETPLYRLCLLLEYQTVNLLLRRFDADGSIDEWVDGFLAEQVEPSTRGVAFTGRCWCGRVSDVSEYEGPFEAAFELSDDRTSLAKFTLRFGDAATLTRERVIAPHAPETMVDQVLGYHIVVQKGHSDGEWASGGWAFQIEKTS